MPHSSAVLWVEDAHGEILARNLYPYNGLAVAQRLANERGETVYVRSEDDGAEAVPTAVAPQH